MSGKPGQAQNASYTRYADDLTFSSDSKYFDDLSVAAVSQIVTSFGFTLNPGKTHRIGLGHRHVVAGISASRDVKAPRATRRRWRALFFQAGEAPAAFKDRASELLGIAGYVMQYDAELGLRYRDVAARARDA